MDLILHLMLWLYGAGFAVLIWSFARSPEGFEDTHGFHTGRERNE